MKSLTRFGIRTGTVCCTVVLTVILVLVLKSQTYEVSLASRDELIQSQPGLVKSKNLAFSIQQSTKYTDLMQQSKFKFNPNFKNPCWYEGNQLRCLPYMYIFGVKKCGTTDLFKRLVKHPDFVDPGFREAQWFAHKRFENNGTGDINEYVKMFNDVAKKIARDSSTRTKYITGEKSPSNLHINSHWKTSPGNENLQEPKFVNLDYIQHFLPKVKILVIFRNPVDRLFSDYYHEYGTLMPGHQPNIQEFHKIVEKGINLYTECFKSRSIRSCVYEPSIYEETKIQIQLGIYYIYWQDILRLFPRDQILVLKTEHLRHHFNSDMKSVFDFLQITKLSDAEMFKYGIAVSKDRPASRRNPMLAETANMLYEFYEPFNKIMADLSGDEEFLYKRP